jgi:hypothetical protein
VTHLQPGYHASDLLGLRHRFIRRPCHIPTNTSRSSPYFEITDAPSSCSCSISCSNTSTPSHDLRIRPLSRGCPGRTSAGVSGGRRKSLPGPVLERAEGSKFSVFRPCFCGAPVRLVSVFAECVIDVAKLVSPASSLEAHPTVATAAHANDQRLAHNPYLIGSM